MNGGIMGDDCFLSKVGAPLAREVVAAGISEINWAGMVSRGEGTGLCTGACDEVVRG